MKISLLPISVIGFSVLGFATGFLVGAKVRENTPSNVNVDQSGGIITITVNAKNALADGIRDFLS